MIIMFLKILCILITGIALGRLYERFFVTSKIKAENKELRKIEVEQIVTGMGTIEARTSEWPLDAEEYLEFHSIERDGGSIDITYEGMETHLEVYARHLMTRQKRDFIKMLKVTRSTDEILKKINL
jgi:hypothetical protein